MNKRNVGSIYEEIAHEYLLENNFQIVDTNFCCKAGEIDIIAIKDNIIRFIEVKYRNNSKYGYPQESVDKNKQRKIYKTAMWYLKEYPKYENMQMSFDVIAICGTKLDYIFNSFGVM
jgi:putative endonuclease